MVQEASKLEQSGVPMWKDGPPCSQTAGKQRGLTTSRTASGFATGIRNCMTGSWATGIGANRFFRGALKNRVNVSEGKKEFRKGMSFVFRNQTGLKQRIVYVSTLSQSLSWNRGVSFLAGKTALCQSSWNGQSALKAVGKG